MASRLVKLLNLLDLLSRQNGATINEIAERLGISRRAVYRQIEEVEELCIPLYDDKEPGKARKDGELMRIM